MSHKNKEYSNKNMISTFIEELSYLGDFEDNYFDPKKLQNIKLVKDYNSAETPLTLCQNYMQG